MEPYATSLEHVLAELARVQGLLHQRLSPGDGGEPDDGELDARRTALDDMESTRDARLRESLRAGVPLRLVDLARGFGLDDFDVDAILLSLLPEIDLEFEMGYGRLQGSRGRSWPSVDLILEIFHPSIDARVEARARFTPGAPLLRHGLVRLLSDGPDLSSGLPAQLVRVDPRVASYLLGSDEVDPELRSHARVVAPAITFDDLILPADLVARLCRFVEPRGETSPIVYLQGPYGAGKRATAEALCHGLGIKLLAVDGALYVAGEEPIRQLARRAGREARLQGAALYWEGAEALLDEDKPAVQAAFLDAIEAHPGLTFLAGKGAWEPTGTLSRRDFIRVELPRPNAAEQARLWETALGRGLAPDVDLEALTGAYRLTGGQIRDAAATAQNLALFRAPGEPVKHAEIVTAARLHSTRKLSSLGHLISPRALWDDLVLPPDQRDRLVEICAHLRHRGKVMDGWGFDRKMALGKGVSALFSGPPGTGKTLAAGVMARELGLDLYHVELPAILSKYIGETEKNLSQLFDEAEQSNAILFFDEADTLFGKRTEVKDAHDRNANLEASYMLQRMEAYEGMSILASNFTKNMDEAFVRRIRFMVEFPSPNERDRRRIWDRAFPPEAPRADDLDLDFLARKIDLAGGYIRNIALRAAFLAASKGDVIRMGHLLTAARWEYQKMGKVVDYARFVHPAARVEGSGG
jgi:SpoVK/Ycf46/Vps4 family AAA+-type ATPase